MICELHNEEANLCDSHIIPRFVYKWMKETGTGRLRQSGNRNRPILDGIKKRMLCKVCENKFSIVENWFKQNIFKPYLSDNNLIVKNEKELEYFAISILWRIIKLFKDDGNNYNFKSELDEAELEWKKYLLKDMPLTKYKNNHLILIDDSFWIDQASDLYFSRAVDIEIGESNSVCFIYAKFSRFMIIGEIIGFDNDHFINTNISNQREFKNTNQMMYGMSDFFRSRIDNTTSYNSLSDIQKQKNDAYYKDKIDKLENTDYMKIIKKYK